MTSLADRFARPTDLVMPQREVQWRQDSFTSGAKLSDQLVQELVEPLSFGSRGMAQLTYHVLLFLLPSQYVCKHLRLYLLTTSILKF